MKPTWVGHEMRMYTMEVGLLKVELYELCPKGIASGKWQYGLQMRYHNDSVTFDSRLAAYAEAIKLLKRIIEQAEKQ